MTTSNEHNNAPAVLTKCEALEVAIWRLEDMLKADDGQAWKEAEKALPRLREALLFQSQEPVVPQGEPVAWMVYGNYTRQPFGMLSSAEAYMRGLLKSDPDGGYHIRPLRYTTPAPAPAQGEPFGHFRAEPFGWTDCAEDDEGAIALYERPQEVVLTDEGRQQVFIAAERRMVREPNLSWRDAIVDEVIAALRAKEQS